MTITDLVVTATITIAVVLLATFVPALRAARTSTVSALADTARIPRRRGWLIAVSRRLPTALLLGLRLIARRPRRLILTATSVAITTATIVAVVAAYARNQPTATGYTTLDDPRVDAIHQVLLVLTAVLLLLAATNTMFVTWATIADTRHAVALNRALGATTRQVNAGLLASLLLPAAAGAQASAYSGASTTPARWASHQPGGSSSSSWPTSWRWPGWPRYPPGLVHIDRSHPSCSPTQHTRKRRVEAVTLPWRTT
jgi:putative ABC transport system permease protein